MENFKYYICINQRAIVELGLDLDFTDVSIFEYIKSFSNSSKCVKVNTDDGIFFWVSHKNIMDEMPMLRIKTAQGIINRVEKLISAGLLAKYKDCEKFGKTLYAFGPTYDLYEGFETPKENLRVLSTKVEGNSILLNNNTPNTLFNNKDISPNGGESAPVDDGFDAAWKAYGRKGNKMAAHRYWKKLSAKDRKSIMDTIPLYLAAMPDEKYRKDFSGWINPTYRRWEDKIVNNNQQQTRKENNNVWTV